MDIAKFIQEHWAVISAAPWVFVQFGLLLIALTWGLAALWYRREIADSKRQAERANEIAAGKPSFGNEFSRLTNAEVRESALQLVKTVRAWKLAAEQRGRPVEHKRDAERRLAAESGDREKMAAVFHSQGAASTYESAQMIADFTARFKVRLESHYEELLRRMPEAQPSPNHHFQHVMNPYHMDRMADALEKLAMQLT